MLEAERLFATIGIHRATTRDITAAAQQRNNSALAYHFGSRTELLMEIIRRHEVGIEAGRLDLAGPEPATRSTRDLVAALVTAYGGALADQRGRYYLRIVSQMSDQFAVWRRDDHVSHPNLIAILDDLERRADGDSAVRYERVVLMIMLLTTAMAERARQCDAEVAPSLDTATFLANLVDVMVGVLEAPAGLSPVEASARPGRSDR